MTFTFNVETILSTTDDSVEYTMIGLKESGGNHQVIFSQDNSLVGDDSFTELGIALTKYGYICGPSAALDGTITLCGFYDGVAYTGTLADGTVTLTNGANV